MVAILLNVLLTTRSPCLSSILNPNFECSFHCTANDSYQAKFGDLIVNVRADSITDESKDTKEAINLRKNKFLITLVMMIYHFWSAHVICSVDLLG